MIWSRSFKQFFLGLSLVCLITSLVLYLVDPSDPGVTIKLNGYSQGEASLIMALIGFALIAVYYIGAKIFHSDYVEDPSKKDNEDQWKK